MSGITRDEWLRALNGIGFDESNDPDAVTVREFMALFDLTESTALAKLDALVAAGKATLTKKWGYTPQQRRIQYRAYRLAENKAKTR